MLALGRAAPVLVVRGAVGLVVRAVVARVLAAGVPLPGLVQPVVVHGAAMRRRAALAGQPSGLPGVPALMAAVLQVGAVLEAVGVLEVLALGAVLDVVQARALAVVMLVVVGTLVVVGVCAGAAPGAGDVAAVPGVGAPGPLLGADPAQVPLEVCGHCGYLAAGLAGCFAVAAGASAASSRVPTSCRSWAAVS